MNQIKTSFEWYVTAMTELTFKIPGPEVGSQLFSISFPCYKYQHTPNWNDQEKKYLLHKFRLIVYKSVC